jgi:hypothetical protein
LAAISATTTSITQREITWEFSTPVEYGQFINGDYWVIDSGSGVTITNILPGYKTETDGAIWARTPREINGSTLNYSDIPQGYDSYRDYDESLNVGKTLPIVLAAGDSLISTKSFPQPEISQPDGYKPSYVDDAAVLTVLSVPPPADTFRPAFDGTNKKIYQFGDLDESKLKNYSYTGKPDIDALLTKTKVPFLHGGSVSTRYMHPNSFGGNYYWSRDEFATLALALHLDYSQKDEILINFIQLGIDLFASLRISPGSWRPDGGHNGEKLPITFAAVMFNDAEMLEYLSRSGSYYLENGYSQTNLPTDWVRFGEDAVHYIDQYMVDLTNAEGWVGYNTKNNKIGVDYPYTQEMIGMPEWGNRNSGFWDCTSDWSGAPYRTIGTGGGGYLPAAAMAIRLLDGGKDAWHNDAFFDYVDRYMAIANGDPDPFGYTVVGEQPGARPGGLTGYMYDTYRMDYTYPPYGDPTCSDGIPNGDETGVDCGGSCPPCETPVQGLRKGAFRMTGVVNPVNFVETVE